MSVKVTNWVWHDQHTMHLRGNAFTALMALADIADDDGNVIYAKGEKRSQAALARKARMSVATFRRMTDALATQGLLEVTRESQRTENAYRILMTAQVERSVVSGHDAQIERSERSLGERSKPDRPLIGRSDVVDIEKPRKSAGRGTRIPEPFTIDDLMRRWAATNTPGVNVDAETEAFVDYWRGRTGQIAVKADWPATWRNWMRRASERVPAGVATVPPVDADASVRARDEWLRSRGITYEEYLEHVDEPGWLDSLERRAL